MSLSTLQFAVASGAAAVLLGLMGYTIRTATGKPRRRDR